MQTTKLVLTGSLLALGFGSVFSGCTFSHASEPGQGEAQGQAAEASSDEDGAGKTAAAKPVVAKTPEKSADKVTAKPVAHPPKATAATKPAVKPSAAGSAKGAPVGDEKLVRYVTADLLNVHSSPRTDSPVTAKIKKGSMFTVSLISGDWAKLSDGQYVLSRYLSPKQTTGYKVVMGR